MTRSLAWLWSQNETPVPSQMCQVMCWRCWMDWTSLLKLHHGLQRPGQAALNGMMGAATASKWMVIRSPLILHTPTKGQWIDPWLKLGFVWAVLLYIRFKNSFGIPFSSGICCQLWLVVTQIVSGASGGREEATQNPGLIAIYHFPHGYGSIPIDTIFGGMNIHLPAILMFTRYQGFDPPPHLWVERTWQLFVFPAFRKVPNCCGNSLHADIALVIPQDPFRNINRKTTQMVS